MSALGFVGRFVALLDLKRYFVCPAVLRPLESSNCPGDARVHIGACPGDHPRRECRRVKFVLGVKRERHLHGMDPLFAWRFAVQQMQKMLGQRLAVCINGDPLAVARVVVPVEKHRRVRSQQPIGNGACPGFIVIVGFGPHASKHRNAGAQYVHRVRPRGQLLECVLHLVGQRARAQAGVFCMRPILRRSAACRG